MFYDQIESSDAETTGAEYGVDVKIFKWVGKRETVRVLTQMQKLQRVVEFIKNSKKIGTVDKPSTYFTGTLDMKWGSLEGKMALFVGGTPLDMVILGGSLKHVIGATPDGHVATSALPAIFAVFKQCTDMDIPEAQSVSTRPALQRVLVVADRFYGPRQRLEFLATNYIFENNVLLGTPFYVALAD